MAAASGIRPRSEASPEAQAISTTARVQSRRPSMSGGKLRACTQSTKAQSRPSRLATARKVRGLINSMACY
jgi:hypothetical protein